MLVLVLESESEDDPNFYLTNRFRSGECGRDDDGPWIGYCGDPDDVWRLRKDGRWDLCCYIDGDLDRWSVAGHAVLLPRLTDPATLGCLLVLVREAWGGADIFGLHYHCDGAWCVEINDRHFYAPTEAAALVAALEAVP